METISNLFGSPMSSAMKLILLTIALVVVLLVVFWIFRKFMGSPAIKAARGRQPRLAVTDAASLDDKRRLVLVRRDDVEHLVMIGGTSDVLIESNIVRVQPVQSQAAVKETHAAASSEVQTQEVKSDTDLPGVATLATGAAAVGAVAASAVSISKADEATAEPEHVELSPVAPMEVASELNVEPEISINPDDLTEAIESDVDTNNEIVSEIDTANDLDLAATGGDTDNTEPTIPVATPIEDHTPNEESAPIEATTLEDIGEALGEELGITADAVKPENNEPEAEIATATNSQDQAEVKETKVNMEDDMQKLLDELSGEKA